MSSIKVPKELLQVVDRPKVPLKGDRALYVAELWNYSNTIEYQLYSIRSILKIYNKENNGRN